MIAAVIVTAVIAQNVRSDKNISGGPYSHLYYFTGRILSCNPKTKDITVAIEDTEETDEKILDELSKAITKRKTELHNAR